MKTLKRVTTAADLKELEDSGVIIEFEPLEEDLNPEDSFEDKQDVKNVIEEYNSGNMAAWFCAKVTVKHKTLEETDYLGGCSYRSFKEFTSGITDYYGDMVNTCIDSINKEIISINQDIQKAWNLRRAKNLVKQYNYSIIQNSAIL